MTEHLHLIARQLTHLQRMREYLAHSVQRCEQIIRELRNVVNHEYEEDAERLTQFFMEMTTATPELFACHQKLLGFCREAYGVKPE